MAGARWVVLGWVAAGALMPLVSAGAQSLDEALAQSYWNNPTLKAERSALAATDHGVAEALSAWRPTVTADLNRGRTYIKAHDSDDTRATAILPGKTASVTLSQRIADFGRTSGALRGAEARVLAGRAALADTEQVVLLNTAEAYLSVVYAQHALELNRANVQVLGRQLEATEAGFTRQMKTMTDLAQARARHADALAELRRAEKDLDSARGRYLELVGEEPGTLEFPAAAPVVPVELDGFVKQAEDAYPRVLSAMYALESARAAVDASEAEIMPTVSFEASDRYQTNSSVSVSDERVQTIGLVVRAPLYQSGAEYARIQARKQELGQRRLLLEAARRAARQNALETWNGLAAARARLESFDASVKANQVARDGVSAEYMRLGNRTLLDVLNAEQELFNARIHLIGARRDEAVAAYRGMAAMGRMTAESLKLAVVRYDPVRHYDEVRGKWFGWGDDVSAGEAPPPAR